MDNEFKEEFDEYGITAKLTMPYPFTMGHYDKVQKGTKAAEGSLNHVKESCLIILRVIEELTITKDGETVTITKWEKLQNYPVEIGLWLDGTGWDYIRSRRGTSKKN